MCYVLSSGHHHHHPPTHGHEKSASSSSSYGMISTKSSGAVEAAPLDHPQVAIPTEFGKQQQFTPAIKPPDGSKDGEAAAKEEGGGDGGDGYPTQLAIRTVMMNRRSVEPTEYILLTSKTNVLLCHLVCLYHIRARPPATTFSLPLLDYLLSPPLSSPDQ